MKQYNELLAWIDTRRDLWLDVIRIYLGLGLFVRGLILFSQDGGFLVAALSASGQPWLLSAFALHYVALAHFCGGIALALGLLTRVAALVQIPILVGAVFFIHWEDGLFGLGQSLEFSALVLFLLVVMTIAGAGRLSMDHYLFPRKVTPPEVRASASRSEV